ncbi:hypothetical protein [Bacillus cereus group sp. TH152-1LC]|uniref:hypothetical protein n=1 Tax=Bacillus cereus group sp. TH152-1LC TaxID=3018060 RepID=UPI0022E48EED|nr:hypothetical protein [Bacillus cereus group sp. TH152-1LC]MDA1675291.1 hypothetical protein [Bacillus cereus group sp. TH152-1LC]
MEERMLEEMVLKAYRDYCMEEPNNIPEVESITKKVIDTEKIDAVTLDEYELKIKNVLDKNRYTYRLKGQVDPDSAVIKNVW